MAKSRAARRSGRKPIHHVIVGGFCTTCGETADWIMASADTWEHAESAPVVAVPATKTADELVPGDVFHYDTMNTWRIVQRVSETAKTVNFRFEYVATTYESSRLGTSRVKTFRKSTRFTLA